jgi:DNA-binding transcriptional LysR family regulator
VPDIRTTDLNLLKAFDALMDERSVTRAATRLSLTQPAVSGMLTRLRDAFDDPLFVRTQRGVTPTLRALTLAPGVKRVLADIEAMLQPSAFDPGTARMTFSVAATDYALRAVMLPLVRALRPLAPGVRVAVRPLDESQLPTQFERGDIDLALITPDTATGDLHARKLYEESYVCALRADHPEVQKGPLTVERFCALEHVLVSYAGDPFRGATDAALDAQGLSRSVVLSINNFLVLPELLRSSDLTAVVPRRLVQDADGLALLQPPLGIRGFTKIAVWHERSHRDPGQQWVRQLLFDTIHETL